MRADGQLVCFGGSRFRQNFPEDLGPVLAVSAGNCHTCAVRADGQLVCVGAINGCEVPEDLGPVLVVSAGYFHTCAVRSDGQLVCFGENEFGKCDVPEDLGPVLAVSAGHVHTCAVLSETVMGSVMCPTADHAENSRERLPSNLQQFKSQMLPIITLNSVVSLT